MADKPKEKPKKKPKLRYERSEWVFDWKRTEATPILSIKRQFRKATFTIIIGACINCSMASR